MGKAALALLWGVLTLGGLLLFFWVLGAVIEWPERLIRRLFKKKTPPHQHAPKPPQHHPDDGFDHPA